MKFKALALSTLVGTLACGPKTYLPPNVGASRLYHHESFQKVPLTALEQNVQDLQYNLRNLTEDNHDVLIRKNGKGYVGEKNKGFVTNITEISPTSGIDSKFFYIVNNEWNNSDLVLRVTRTDEQQKTGVDPIPGIVLMKPHKPKGSKWVTGYPFADVPPNYGTPQKVNKDLFWVAFSDYAPADGIPDSVVRLAKGPLQTEIELPINEDAVKLYQEFVADSLALSLGENRTPKIPLAELYQEYYEEHVLHAASK